MGDFRLHFKGKATLCGISKDIDWSINYSPGDYGVDERIIEFFKDLYEEAHAKYILGIVRERQEKFMMKDAK